MTGVVRLRRLRDRPTTVRSMLAVTSGLILGGVIAVVVPVSAAKASFSCSGTPYNAATQNSTGDHRGERAQGGIYVEDTDASCGRVSSIIVTSSDGHQQVEAGWYDVQGLAADEGQSVCGYPSSASGPHQFWNYVINGTFTCPTSLPPAETMGADPGPTFAVVDANYDGNWRFQQGASWYGPEPYIPKLTGGLPTSNGERHSSADYGFAHFQGLQFDHGGTWTNFTSTRVFAPSWINVDPNFCPDIISNTDVENDPC
jgi:hypothetical protein